MSPSKQETELGCVNFQHYIWNMYSLYICRYDCKYGPRDRHGVVDACKKSVEAIYLYETSSWWTLAIPKDRL